MKANHTHTTMPFVCHKKRHATLEAARQAIRAMKAWPDCDRPGSLNAYWCPACRAYHVGHSRWIEGRA